MYYNLHATIQCDKMILDELHLSVMKGIMLLYRKAHDFVPRVYKSLTCV